MTATTLPGDPTCDGLYAAPRVVTDLKECWFYHSMEIPGYGPVEGQWDLRGGTDDYVGRVALAGRRVLEVGTASGYLCFWMEDQGAEVVAFDLGDGHDWDSVPFPQLDAEQVRQRRRLQLRRLQNGFWLAHRCHGSAARVVYGTAYDIPAAVGPVDVATLGCVLLHLRDPFRALASAARLAREAVVVTEPMIPLHRGKSLAARLRRKARTLLQALPWGRLPAEEEPGLVAFLPEPRGADQPGLWWSFTPAAIRRFLAALGFEDCRVVYHTQKMLGRPSRLFTVVGRRTRGEAEAGGAA